MTDIDEVYEWVRAMYGGHINAVQKDADVHSFDQLVVYIDTERSTTTVANINLPNGWVIDEVSVRDDELVLIIAEDLVINGSIWDQFDKLLERVRSGEIE